MLSKNLLAVSSYFVVLFIINGCGTDVKPTYFTDIFKDPNELNRLSECVNDMSLMTDDDEVVVHASIPCLIELSKKHTAIPNEPVIDASLAEILDNPEAYIGKIFTFEATIKGWRYKLYEELELYTNRLDRNCYVLFDGFTFTLSVFHSAKNPGSASTLTSTALRNKKYKWSGMSIYGITVNKAGIRNVYISFILDANDNPIRKPIFVEEPDEENE